MKKSVILLIAAIFVTMPLASSFAKNAPEKSEKAEANKAVVTGKIVTIDVAKNEVMVKEGKKEQTFTATPEMIAGLKVGEKVHVKFDPKTKVAESIKKIPHDKKK